METIQQMETASPSPATIIETTTITDDASQCPLPSSDVSKRKHPEEEETGEKDHGPSRHPLWKTSLCSYFRSHSGSCSHGNGCRFAHGEDELRPRPDNSWDPTSERAKKLLKTEGDNGRKECIQVGLTPRQDVCPHSADSSVAIDGGSSAFNKCLLNLPKNWTSEKFQSFLDREEITYESARKKMGMQVGFVNFGTQEKCLLAVEKLDGKTLGHRHIKVADVIPRHCDIQSSSTSSLAEISGQHLQEESTADIPLGSSVSDKNEEDEDVGNGFLANVLPPKMRQVRDVVTPLAHMPYDDQLDHKKRSLIQMLRKLTRNARKACPEEVELPDWVLKSRDISGLPCNLEGIIRSPMINGYRNKCEFSLGYSLSGELTVGFMLGNFRDGIVAVEGPDDCPNVSNIARQYALIFQDFLRSSSVPVWNRVQNVGFWRQFTMMIGSGMRSRGVHTRSCHSQALEVREGRTPSKESLDMEGLESGNTSIAEVMLIVQICSIGVDEELKTNEFRRMTHMLSHAASTCSPPLPLTSLVVQDHVGISNAAPVDSPLFALTVPKKGVACDSEEENASETRIHDYINGLRFSISPTAFFQVNTLAAEKLYSLAGDWAGLGPDTLLFDICCGTGTIGLTLAHRVGMVVGIEMNSSAVSDAERNAEINGIKNCRFICGKAEEVMGSLLKDYLSPLEQHDKFVHTSGSYPEETISSGSADCCNASDSNEHDASTTNDKENGVHCFEVSNGQKMDPFDGVSDLTCDSVVGETGVLNQKDDASDCHKEIPNDKLCEVRPFKDVVAIVDPPRVGLHHSVIKALRTYPSMRRIIYVSCNPESLVANAIELCTPSSTGRAEKVKGRGYCRNISSAGLARQRVKSMPLSEPFRPVKAVAVDLFPHTPHCEMVMLLER